MPLWDQMSSSAIFATLEDIRQQLLIQVARRTFELRNLHSRVSGQKNASMLLKAVNRRFPQIKKLISQHNAVSVKLSQSCVVGTMDTKTFGKMICNIDLRDLQRRRGRNARRTIMMQMPVSPKHLLPERGILTEDSSLM